MTWRTNRKHFSCFPYFSHHKAREAKPDPFCSVAHDRFQYAARGVLYKQGKEDIVVLGRAIVGKGMSLEMGQKI